MSEALIPDANTISFILNDGNTDVLINISVNAPPGHNRGQVNIEFPISEGSISTSPITVCFIGDTITWEASTFPDKTPFPLTLNLPPEQKSLRIIKETPANVVQAFVECTGNVSYDFTFHTFDETENKETHTHRTKKLFKVDPYVSCNPCSGGDTSLITTS